MKRVIALVLSVLLLCGLCGCNAAKDTGTTHAVETTTPKPVTPSTPCKHENLGEATCTNPARCEACKRPIGLALGHDWGDGSCSRCGKNDPLAEKENGIVRVVCVGDSITRGGYYGTDFGGLLYDRYEVIGLGVNGATGLSEGLDQGKPWAYILHDEYKMSLRYRPDIVVIMLGTNDTKGPNYNKIKKDDGAQYKADMIALIDSYRALDTQPQIFLALPPTIYREWTASGINNEALEEMLLTLLVEIAAETGAIVIDTHTATAGQSEKFPDGVHPNAEGKAVIAQTVGNAILANAPKGDD